MVDKRCTYSMLVGCCFFFYYVALIFSDFQLYHFWCCVIWDYKLRPEKKGYLIFLLKNEISPRLYRTDIFDEELSLPLPYNFTRHLECLSNSENQIALNVTIYCSEAGGNLQYENLTSRTAGSQLVSKTDEYISWQLGKQVDINSAPPVVKIQNQGSGFGSENRSNI